VSAIPFVDRLGDAIQAATTDPAVARCRRRRVLRRRLLLAVAALLLLGGSLAAAELLNEPEKLATGSIGCYQDAGMRGTVTIIWPDDQTPVQALRGDVPGGRPAGPAAGRLRLPWRRGRPPRPRPGGLPAPGP
jgi:hypothetical protein